MGDGREIMRSSLLSPSVSSRAEVILLRSPISAEELLGFLRNTEVDAPILPQEDPRWERLRPRVDLDPKFSNRQVAKKP
jgi:hypothetical protein